jgi:hypothetical protein
MSDATSKDQIASCCPDGCNCSDCCDDRRCDCAGFMSKMMEMCCKPGSRAEQGSPAASGKGCC